MVAVSGGLHSPSKSAVLSQHLLTCLARAAGGEQRLVELGKFASQLGAAIRRSDLPESVERQLQAVEQADALVVVTPVYRGSYTGLFKHFFDFINQDALVDKPVLLAATGGSNRHALVIDHQLRPLFSFFQARTSPLGIYATDQDFSDRRLQSEAVIQRVALAVQRILPLLDLARDPQNNHFENLDLSCKNREV